jgi:RNA polymerase sigma-54 factor
MVSVLALNKLELKEMINTEMVENPVLEELEDSALPYEERAAEEGDRERSAEEKAVEAERVEKDPFDEIDFGSYFQDYLDPGFRTTSNFEEFDKPSFENFLSQPSTLNDHLLWQLGALTLTPGLKAAAELIIGNLNEDGYLIATDDELIDAMLESRVPPRAAPIPFERGILGWADRAEHTASEGAVTGIVQIAARVAAQEAAEEEDRSNIGALVRAARDLVHQLDPVGIGARDLRECLLAQIAAQRREAAIVLKRRQSTQLAEAMLAREDLIEQLEPYSATPDRAPDPDRPADRWSSHLADHLVDRAVGSPSARVDKNPCGSATDGPTDAHVNVFDAATHIVANCLQLLQKRDMRELTRSCGRTAEDVQAAVDFIRTLDPRPGQRYNHAETRLIEPDVAFVKRDGVYVVVMNEEDMPTLRLNQSYRRMLRQKQTEKDVRDYVKERYKSAIQLLRNIEQRKNTILRTCEVIVRRQAEFLEHGEQALKPMMIKDVAEEIGVHPSTVSRAVANKYVHTTQGVYELRFFFTEGVNGPEGGDLPLVLLKRKVKKLIEEEDARKPLTDDQLAAELQRQGIQVTRRTVAKYREDMQIPSTHQRRVR